MAGMDVVRSAAGDMARTCAGNQCIVCSRLPTSAFDVWTLVKQVDSHLWNFYRLCNVMSTANIDMMAAVPGLACRCRCPLPRLLPLGLAAALAVYYHLDRSALNLESQQQKGCAGCEGPHSMRTRRRQRAAGGRSPRAD